MKWNIFWLIHGSWCLQSLKVGLGISVVSHGGDMRIERSCGLGPPFPSHTDTGWQCIWWGQLSYTPRYKWSQIAAILWQLNLVINTGGDIYTSHKNLTFRHHTGASCHQLTFLELWAPSSHATSRCQRPGHFIIQSWLQTFTQDSN